MNIRNERGAVLILSFALMIALTAVVGNYLYATSVVTKSAGFGEVDDKSLWLAEAGVNKALWNLMTPTGSGGEGEDWTTSGTTENLGDGEYEMVVERWDWALSDNGSSASASSVQGGSVAAQAIDADDDTFWESRDKPTPSSPESITINFPYPLTLNKVRFLVTGAAQRKPEDYTWQVSSDDVSYTTVVTVTGNTDMDVTDTFSPVGDVEYLMLEVTDIPAAGGSQGVRVATLEAIGSKITSTGTIGDIERAIEVSAALDDGTTFAFKQIDWDEIAP